MTLAAIRLRGQWLLAAALLLFGLLAGGLACPPSTPGHLPSRAEARAGSVQQALERRADPVEQHVNVAEALPLLAALLLVVATFHVRSQPEREATLPHDVSGLWLTPYLFRPPPFLVG